MHILIWRRVAPFPPRLASLLSFPSFPSFPPLPVYFSRVVANAPHYLLPSFHRLHCTCSLCVLSHNSPPPLCPLTIPFLRPYRSLLLFCPLPAPSLTPPHLPPTIPIPSPPLPPFRPLAPSLSKHHLLWLDNVDMPLPQLCPNLDLPHEGGPHSCW